MSKACFFYTYILFKIGHFGDFLSNFEFQQPKSEFLPVLECGSDQRHLGRTRPEDSLGGWKKWLVCKVLEHDILEGF